MFLKDRFILQNPSHPFLVLRRTGRMAKDGGCPSVILRKNGPPSLSLRVRIFGEDHIPLVSPWSLTILFRIVWEFSTQLNSRFCPVFLPARPSSTRRAMSAGACFLL